MQKKMERIGFEQEEQQSMKEYVSTRHECVC